jgi:hypothetical protein
MNITINPGAATDDAAQIDSLVQSIEESAETLNNAIKNTIPSGIQTTWSETVRSNWESYYTADIPQALEDMRLSATNLRMAVEQALNYDQEK